MPRVITDYPIAVDSVDHLIPRGTLNDNSTKQEFNDRLLALFPSGLSVLDLGCAGGGFVHSLIRDGVRAFGIEGSDRSQQMLRAEWGPEGCPDALATADISRPFIVLDSDGGGRFKVVTLWEVLEHIANEDLPQLFENIDKHLEPGGVVIASISTVTDECHIVDDDGNVLQRFHYHQIVCSKDWWMLRLADLGWRCRHDLVEWFDGTWVRNHATSFHVVLERSHEE